MNHRNLKIALASAALAVSGAAMADGPDWTFVQGQYGWGDSAPDGENTRGGILGSAQLFDVGHIGAQYTMGQFDDGADDTDVDIWQINAGAHVGVSDTADVYGEVIFGNIDIDEFDDADFYGAAFGTRVMLTDNVELKGGVEVLSVELGDFVGGSDDDTTYVSPFIAGRFMFNDLFSFGVTATDDNVRFGDQDSVEFDLRFSFGDPTWLGNN